jgi:uncharacterized protein (DUF2249 family)/iron-sulfur cluster repair protein YtfE (RIC family)
MSILTDAVRDHHLSLAKALETHAHAVGGGEPQSERDAFLAFLKGDLVPHAIGEQRHLYSLVDVLVRKHGKATATMMVDHEFINDYVTSIEQITQQLGTATGGGRAQLLQRLHELDLRLDAILELHLAKEERIYLPLIEERVDDARQRNVLEAVHESYDKNGKTPEERPVDVRSVIPRGRHRLIFDTFTDLKPGEAFVLINDHDPRPLNYQFQSEHTGQFSWDYLEQGPDIWRVRIGRDA